jgi:hypothetical protein
LGLLSEIASGATILIFIAWVYYFNPLTYSDPKGNNATDFSIAQARVVRVYIKLLAVMGFMLIVTGWATLSCLNSERRNSNHAATK